MPIKSSPFWRAISRVSSCGNNWALVNGVEGWWDIIAELPREVTQ